MLAVLKVLAQESEIGEHHFSSLKSLRISIFYWSGNRLGTSNKENKNEVEESLPKKIEYGSMMDSPPSDAQAY